MTYEGTPITCTGCTREIRVLDLCIHTAPTCTLCCGIHCGSGRDPWDNGIPAEDPDEVFATNGIGWETGGRRFS